MRVFIAIILLCSPALAHDHKRPELNGWFESLHSGKGPCCDGSDAKRVDDADWETKNGHYRVRIDGEWWDVPDEAVIKAPNMAGRTMAWPVYHSPLGGPVQIEIRCFIAGAQG